MPRILVAVATAEGARAILNVGRPRDLIAFADAHVHNEPQTIRELAWLTHHALNVEAPLDDWIDTLDELTAAEASVQRLRDEWIADGSLDPTAPSPPPSPSPAAANGADPLAAPEQATSGEVPSPA